VYHLYLCPPRDAQLVDGRTMQADPGEGKETRRVSSRISMRMRAHTQMIFPHAGITLIRCDGRWRPLATLSARLPELPRTVCCPCLPYQGWSATSTNGVARARSVKSRRVPPGARASRPPRRPRAWAGHPRRAGASPLIRRSSRRAHRGGRDVRAPRADGGGRDARAPRTFHRPWWRGVRWSTYAS